MAGKLGKVKKKGKGRYLENPRNICNFSIRKTGIRGGSGVKPKKESVAKLAQVVSCMETSTAARGSTQDNRKNQLAAVPVSMKDLQATQK
jgi:hypothetical protein